MKTQTNPWKQMNKHSLRHKSKNRNSKKIQPEENQEMKIQRLEQEP